MNKNRIFPLALALLLTVSFTGLTTSEAQAAKNGQPEKPGFGRDAYTPEQYEEMRNMREAHFNKTGALHRQLKAKQAELDMLYYNDNKDNGRTQKLFREIADIKAKLYTMDNEFRSQVERKGFRHGMGYRGDYNQGHHFDRGYNHGGRRGGYQGPRGDYNGPRGHGHRGGW